MIGWIDESIDQSINQWARWTVLWFLAENVVFLIFFLHSAYFWVFFTFFIVPGGVRQCLRGCASLKISVIIKCRLYKCTETWFCTAERMRCTIVVKATRVLGFIPNFSTHYDNCITNHAQPWATFPHHSHTSHWDAWECTLPNRAKFISVGNVRKTWKFTGAL